ncbi:MAG: signal recognition particle-docking protein FtsY [Acidobacteriota bacterium]|nr:MAG: signal recognition particle-docking protein FtsY [Acidobacteriota bacterium]
MVTSGGFRDRLKAGLARTREVLSLGVSETPDWERLEESLVLADVGIPATTEILERLRGRGSAEGLRDELLAILNAPSKTASSAAPPRVTMIVGVNGVGKTTTVAKLAGLAVGRGASAIVVAADTFRAAAQEQLATWAERVGVEVIGGSMGRDPASIVHDGVQAGLARGVDEIFVDTAGRLHTKQPLMDELAKIGRVASRVVPEAPHETLLVMDATVGSNGLMQARQFAQSLNLTGIILAKMDGTAKGGVVLAIAKELELPVRYVGIGESVDDLLEFSAEEFVDALVR